MRSLLLAARVAFMAALIAVVAVACRPAESQDLKAPTPSPTPIPAATVAGDPTTSSVPPTAGPASPTAAATKMGGLWQPPEPPVYEPKRPAPFLRYEVRRGGGKPQVVEIGDDWRYMDNAGEPGDLYHLRALIESVRPSELLDHYGDEQGASVVHTLTITSTGQAKTVTFAERDGKSEGPAALVDLTAAVCRMAGLNMPAPPKEAPAPSTITYQVVQLGPTVILQIRADGLARLYYSDEFIGSMQLSGEEMSGLREDIDAAGFKTLSREYTKSDPPGVIAEIPYPTLIVTGEGRSKVVTARGDSGPGGLNTVFKKMSGLEDRVKVKGTPSPAPGNLIGYMLITNDHIWGLGIDTQGGVHADMHVRDEAVGRLSSEELKSLVDLFDTGGFSTMADWLERERSTRDIMTEHRVIVWINKNGYETKVEAVSGAQVPPGYQAILERLVEIHARFLHN